MWDCFKFSMIFCWIGIPLSITLFMSIIALIVGDLTIIYHTLQVCFAFGVFVTIFSFVFTLLFKILGVLD
ncbi:hypothetical protein 000TH008_9 [Bacillus phage 000TH008]|nr:hypothetical protein 000TH008_9 [Bacillus phage 000TH008]QQO40703.1 hypothetical protein 000TH009_9 [Bacillus phage 000TH009]